MSSRVAHVLNEKIADVPYAGNISRQEQLGVCRGRCLKRPLGLPYALWELHSKVVLWRVVSTLRDVAEPGQLLTHSPPVRPGRHRPQVRPVAQRPPAQQTRDLWHRSIAGNWSGYGQAFTGTPDAGSLAPIRPAVLTALCKPLERGPLIELTIRQFQRVSLPLTATGSRLLRMTPAYLTFSRFA